MNKITVVLNDYAANVKSYISYDRDDIDKVLDMWDTPDERLSNLHVLQPFKGYDRWSDLTPEHYRILITRGLNTIAKLPPKDRMNTSDPVVSTTNSMILMFIILLERRTTAEIEHFRINRFDDLNVTFDFSASFELEYDRPKPKIDEPSFSIVIDNSDETS